MKDTFSTDAATEIFKSLQFTIEQLTICKNDSYHWKWAIIGIHNTLQICMASALRDSAGINILKENIRKEYFKLLKEGIFTSIQEKLNYFLELYKDIKSEELFKYRNERKFIPDGNDDYNVKILNGLRNYFIHFIPMGYCSHVVEYLGMFYTSLKILNFLIRDIHCIDWVEDYEQPNTEKLLDKLKLLLDEYSNELNYKA